MRNCVFSKILSVSVILSVGLISIVFALLYVQTFNVNSQNFTALSSFIVIFISIIDVLTISFFVNENKVVYKILLSFCILLCLACFGLYILKLTGIFDKIDSVNDLRVYVSNFGAWAEIIFVVLQIFQVIILPLPTFITIGAGVLLFGPLKTALLSSLGIVIGSYIAFFIGRFLGVKVVKWLIGDEKLNKTLKLIKGRDKVVLTFMFLFPLFPDDLLCFVAGLSTMSVKFFLLMMLIVRTLCVFTSAFSLNNNFIPYDTWWGILLWIIFAVCTIVLTFFVYKHGNKIENLFKRKNKKKFI